MMTRTHFDVIVVGAGLSGVAAGYYLQNHCPDRTYTILEGRDAIGGTWDLFRYPGVRSDSDMLTLGYSFRPWPGDKNIAQGGEILRYIRETAAEYGIDERIRFGHRVISAAWNSDAAQWAVEAVHEGQTVRFTCNFLFMCSGYYRYDKGYTPDWPTLNRYEGCVIHPQEWPADLNLSGQRVVVIGSGATAVTLIPALAGEAAHVTMLQRSPSYIVSRPTTSSSDARLRRALPGRLGYDLARWRSILSDLTLYLFARALPGVAKRHLINLVREELRPGYDVEKHFAPAYNPWEQRVCLTPDSRFFEAIRAGDVSVVTDHITAFTEGGICLESGEELPADVIITATGLIMRIMHGVTLTADGAPLDLSHHLSYRGAMYSNVPNLASVFGYINTSWTLKAELIAEYVCRLLNHMARHDYAQCVPRPPADAAASDSLIDFSSGYIQRAMEHLPEQGTRPPWRLYQNYVLDMLALRYGRLEDGAMTFE